MGKDRWRQTSNGMEPLEEEQMKALQLKTNESVAIKYLYVI